MTERARHTSSRRVIMAYLAAVVPVLLASAIIKAYGEHRVGFSLFYAAVMFAAWFGGLGPGLLATALSAAATAYYFLDPPGSFLIGPDDVFRTLVFTAVAVLISTLHDKTRQAHQAEHAAREAAHAANQAKDRYLAILSHELRTPLTPILTAAALHEHDETLDPLLREDLAMIRRNAELQVRLIDDLLDLHRSTVGKLHIRQQLIDVHGVVREAVKSAQHDVAGKELHMTLDLQATAHHCRADPVRFRQVMSNLLRNAVKFTPQGGAIHVSSDDGPEGRIVIRVSDTGMGIDPETLPRLFVAFQQGSQDVTRSFGGLGLGLAISKALIEAHQGSIHVQSEGKGRGATFTIRLPASPEPSVPHARAADTTRNADRDRVASPR